MSGKKKNNGYVQINAPNGVFTVRKHVARILLETLLRHEQGLAPNVPGWRTHHFKYKYGYDLRVASRLAIQKELSGESKEE